MKKRNIWKALFFLLLTINIVIVAGGAILLFYGGESTDLPESAAIHEKKASEFVIRTDKEDLNILINSYIEKEGLNGPIHYSVNLSDEVELYGEMEVFSQTLQLKMTFVPHALENGDLILEQKSLSLGGVKLPVTYVLKMIGDAYKLPEWVLIQPNEQQVYVALQNLRLNNGIQVRAEKFDLVADDIAMKMYVPVK